MKIEKRKIDELVEDDKNPRAHDERNILAIEKSLGEFGQQKPIVITKNNKVIAGNGTVVAARRLGWTEIDTVTTTLTKVKQSGFAIADNRTGELSAWDNDMLADTLTELSDSGFSLDNVGFVQAEIDEIMNTLGNLEVEEIAISPNPKGFRKSEDEYHARTIKNIQMFFEMEQYAPIVAALEMEKKKRGVTTYPAVLIGLLNDAGYGI